MRFFAHTSTITTSSPYLFVFVRGALPLPLPTPLPLDLPSPPAPDLLCTLDELLFTADLAEAEPEPDGRFSSSFDFAPAPDLDDEPAANADLPFDPAAAGGGVAALRSGADDNPGPAVAFGLAFAVAAEAVFEAAAALVEAPAFEAVAVTGCCESVVEGAVPVPAPADAAAAFEAEPLPLPPPPLG